MKERDFTVGEIGETGQGRIGRMHFIFKRVLPYLSSHQGRNLWNIVLPLIRSRATDLFAIDQIISEYYRSNAESVVDVNKEIQWP